MNSGSAESATDPVSHRFIGHAMRVHSLVGPGLPEEVYHQEIVEALNEDGIEHLSKPRRDLIYKGIVVDTFEPDFVVENRLIPELKSLGGHFAAEHILQVFCYCKFWKLRTSLLVDFGKQSLHWRRLIYPSYSARFPEISVPPFVTSPSLAQEILRAIAECLSEIGLGYRETTWKGLVRAAIQSVGLKVIPAVSVSVRNRTIVSLPSIIVENQCALSVSALSNGLSPTDRAVMQTHLRWLNLDWGIILHFGKKDVDLRFVGHPK